MRQWKVTGQFGDEVVVEAGHGAVYVRTAHDDGSQTTAMLKTAEARNLLECIRQAADESAAPHG